MGTHPICRCAQVPASLGLSCLWPGCPSWLHKASWPSISVLCMWQKVTYDGQMLCHCITRCRVSMCMCVHTCMRDFNVWENPFLKLWLQWSIAVPRVLHLQSSWWVCPMCPRGICQPLFVVLRWTFIWALVVDWCEIQNLATENWIRLHAPLCGVLWHWSFREET